MGYQISAESLPLIIMQCKNCNSIVGDTSEFVCAASWNDNRLVVLGAATNVRVDRIPQQSTVDSDNLSHLPVCCSSCGSVVGCMYTSVPPALAPLKDMFAMDASRCTSYKVGSADVRVQGESEEQGARPTTAPGAEEPMRTTMGNSMNTLDMASRMEALEAELLKMQHIILLHDTQLQQLPGYQSLGNDPP